MSPTPESWVQDDVRDLFGEWEKSAYPYTDQERACWRRLVTDIRMKVVYCSPYLKKRMTAQGWRIWFDLAKGDDSGVSDERERLKKHAALVCDLATHMREATRLIVEIDELDAAERGMLQELYHPFSLLEVAADHQRGRTANTLPGLFAQHIKPVLDGLRQFDIGRYIPSVAQIMAALSDKISTYADSVEGNGPISTDHATASALNSRQSAQLPEYVRRFDAAICDYSWEIGGGDFLIPPEIMAVQAAVALNLREVDKKQITSARKLAISTD